MTKLSAFSRSTGALLLAGLLAAPVAAQDLPFPGNVPMDGYAKLTDALIEVLRKQADKLPAGDRSTRDNLYGILAGFWIAGISGELITSAAGTAIGGGIGACAAGVGAPPGAAIGFGVGAMVGLPALITPAVITIPAVLYIEEKYPVAANAGSGGGAMLRASGSFGSGLAVAGPMESLFVAMIGSMPREVATLAKLWDKTPGLPKAGQEWLQANRGLQQPLQRVAYVMEHRRMSPNAPVAMDLGKAFADWIELPSSTQMRDWYLDQFGLLECKLQLTKKGNMHLDVPRLLQRAGAPADVDVDIPDLDLKVGGNGGLFDPYVRITFSAGPAKLTWGRAALVASGEHKDQIELNWSIADNSTIGHLKVRWKAGGDEQVAADLKPKLGKKFSGSLFFKPDGLALLPAGFALKGSGIDVDLDLPKGLREAADALQDTVGKAIKQAERDLEKLFERNLPWAKVWKQLQGAPGASLLTSIQESPGMFGLSRADKLLDMEIKHGKLRVKVAGQTVVAQKLPPQAGEIAQLFQQALREAGKPLQRPQPRK